MHPGPSLPLNGASETQHMKHHRWCCVPVCTFTLGASLSLSFSFRCQQGLRPKLSERCTAGAQWEMMRTQGGRRDWYHHANARNGREGAVLPANRQHPTHAHAVREGVHDGVRVRPRGSGVLQLAHSAARAALADWGHSPSRNLQAWKQHIADRRVFERWVIMWARDQGGGAVKRAT